MPTLETDYLVIGAGATGLAFADTLLQESDAHITLVDKHAQPGGHWNDAYPFVALHQPSAFYGVASLELGTGRKDTTGHNAGLFELASGAEVTGYFHRVMHQRLLPSGRVRYMPMSEVRGLESGTGHVASLLGGPPRKVVVRKKLVDARFFSPRVPATTPPAFSVAPGVRLVTPTQLTQIWRSGEATPARYCVLGGGKTAMDTCVALLEWGAPPESISWVVPRDSWITNRLTTQPADEFFQHAIGAQVSIVKALAQAADADDVFRRLEADGVMFRVDPRQTPRMFHYATISEGEVKQLRRIEHVIRKGRVLAVETGALVLAQGREAMEAADTLYVDCTASGIGLPTMEPVFQPGRIYPQLVRAPLVTFSAAMCAYVEAHYEDEATKNHLCTPVPFPTQVAGYVASTLGNLANQMRWSQDKTLLAWVRDSRLDAFGKMMARVDPADADKAALIAELRQHVPGAMANGQRLMAAAAA